MNRVISITESEKRCRLRETLAWLTFVFVSMQIVLFIINYKLSDLVDSLVNSSLSMQLFYPIVLFPLLAFIFLQFLAYVLFVYWVWFIAVSMADFFKLSQRQTYALGLLFWAIAVIAMLSLNHYYFPASFFAKLIDHFYFLKSINNAVALFASSMLITMTVCAYGNFLSHRRNKLIALSLLSVIVATVSAFIFDAYGPRFFAAPKNKLALPNVILIGLDSVRPDFLSYFGNDTVKTPTIDHFLRTATTFTHTYTPLARTFPSWVSILTGQYPLHNHARNNLVDGAEVGQDDTLAKRLHAAGYETIYATDEKRFSNITKEFGFDKVLGPQMGLNDFLLGGLSDFPLTNLLVNLPLGRFLFPYNYGNRAAAITYDPNHFLKLVQWGLVRRSDKPLFLTVHLCLSHWPFKWARDGEAENLTIEEQYRDSIQAVDKQLGDLLQLLKQNELLNNSLVFLLSDHGTALGLPGDRFITEKNYTGNKSQIKLIAITKYSHAPQHSTDFKKDYSISTAYGQGNDVLSLKQYHALLAFKWFNQDAPAKWVNDSVALIDIAPTILDFLHLQPLPADGVSLKSLIMGNETQKISRPIFMETGDSLSEIETDHIAVEKVIKKEIGIYQINPDNGLLFINNHAENAILRNKQLAVLLGDWLLVRYPAKLQSKLVPASVKSSKMVLKRYIQAPYFVLANLQTGQWTISLFTPLAQSAPVLDLLAQLKAFYGNEL